MGKTRIILITISILILLGILIIFLLNPTLITGKAIKTETKNTYSYTKAICNETNYCQDYEIICEGEKVISTQPITGAAVQHPENWKDPRDEEMIDRLCG